MPGPEAGLSAAGAAVASATNVEAGLGAAASSLGKVEALSIATPELSLANTLQSMPDTHMGIEAVAQVPDGGGLALPDTPEFNSTLPSGNLRTPEANVPDTIPQGLEARAATTGHTVSTETKVDVQTSATQVEPENADPIKVEVQQETARTEQINTAQQTEGISPNTTQVATRPEGQNTTAKAENSVANGQATQEQGEAKPLTQETTSTKQPEATAPQDAEKAKRTQELEDKVKNKTATAEELKELRGLKQDPEQRRQDLEQKALDGTLTDQEVEELGEMNNKTNPENLTPEQKAEKLKNDIDTLGTEMIQKAANGEQINPEDFKRLQAMKAEQALVNNGFTPEQAQALAKQALRNNQERKIPTEMQKKIQELMGIEMTLLKIKPNIEAYKQHKQKVIEQARSAHDEAESAVDPQDRFQKKGREYNLYMQVANINATLIGTRDKARILNAQRIDTEQYIRRSLGVTSGWNALFEFAGAKINNAVTEVILDVHDINDGLSGLPGVSFVGSFRN